MPVGALEPILRVPKIPFPPMHNAVPKRPVARLDFLTQFVRLVEVASEQPQPCGARCDQPIPLQPSAYRAARACAAWQGVQPSRRRFQDDVNQFHVQSTRVQQVEFWHFSGCFGLKKQCQQLSTAVSCQYCSDYSGSTQFCGKVLPHATVGRNQIHAKMLVELLQLPICEMPRATVKAWARF